MAARINKKRSFLFVSKLLGKHLPIDPNKGLSTSALLAARYYDLVKGVAPEMISNLKSTFLFGSPEFSSTRFIDGSFNPIIIGFAETATALGHAFFDCFQNGDYFHTTREDLINRAPAITFEEEHSHATSHRCYIPLEMLQNQREIILVDDELTTGKTALNIIRSIQAQFPRSEYSVVTILDWRSDEDREGFIQAQKELEIKINVVSLISGEVNVKKVKELAENHHLEQEQKPVKPRVEYLKLPPFFTELNESTQSLDGRINHTPFIKETGRFAIEGRSKAEIDIKARKAADYLLGKRNGTRTLCIGTGEFMYIPMKIASEMGPGIFYQSTTRSPIYIKNEPGYGARFGLSFPNPEDSEVRQFVYNIEPGYYDELFVFFEREPSPAELGPLLSELEKTYAGSIKIVSFTRQRGGSSE